MQELFRLNKSGFFYPSWESSASGGEKKQRSVWGGGGLLTFLMEKGSTFSENKNFSNTRISSQKKRRVIHAFLFLHVIGFV
jgi:hypothetical protein